MEEFKNLKDEIKNNHKQSKQTLIEMDLKQTESLLKKIRDDNRLW